MEVYFSIMFGYAYPLLMVTSLSCLAQKESFKCWNVYLLFMENRRGEIIHPFVKKTVDCFFSSLHFWCFILFHNICYGLHVAAHAKGWLERRHKHVSSGVSFQRNQRCMFVLNRNKVLWRIAAKHISFLCFSFHVFHHKRHCASVENSVGKKE